MPVQSIGQKYSVETLRRAVKTIPQEVRQAAKAERKAFESSLGGNKKAIQNAQHTYLPQNAKLKAAVDDVQRSIALESYMKGCSANNTEVIAGGFFG